MPQRAAHGCAAPPCARTDEAGRTVLDNEAAPPRLWVTSRAAPWAAGEYHLCGEHNGRPVWASACGGKRLFAASGGRWLFGEPAHLDTNQGCVRSMVCRHPLGPHHVSSPEVREAAERARRSRTVQALFDQYDWDGDGFLSFAEAGRWAAEHAGYALERGRFEETCAAMGADPAKGWTLDCLREVHLAGDSESRDDLRKQAPWSLATGSDWAPVWDLQVRVRRAAPPACIRVAARPIAPLAGGQLRPSPLNGLYCLAAQRAGWPSWEQRGGCLALCADSAGAWVIRMKDPQCGEGNFASSAGAHGGSWPHQVSWQLPDSEGAWAPAEGLRLTAGAETQEEDAPPQRRLRIEDAVAEEAERRRRLDAEIAAAAAAPAPAPERCAAAGGEPGGCGEAAAAARKAHEEAEIAAARQRALLRRERYYARLGRPQHSDCSPPERPGPAG
eukprot:TRINITY_DN59969_c0_g1_i1.p1 TRINITY_DN59969_c0_g1~~TRINITY_DN59969_c0_g1_i1.p1  ORF type:complete len:444 (+),score=130.68 TRINITY_DN59969_c0_g1_i1:78-1409(+)